VPSFGQDPAERETAALRLSAASSLALAVLGIAWGLAAASQVILFDSVYALVGFVMAWLSLRAAALVEAGPTPHYPFGREALAPLVVAGQAVVLLGTFGYAVVDAISVILLGGSETELGSALVYAVITTAVCVAVHRVLLRVQEGSDLVAAEAMQWRAAVLLGIAMTLGFAGAVILTYTEWSWFAAYVDPLLVLLVAVLILPAPVRLLRQAFRELLEGAPGADISDPIHAAVTEIRTEFGLPEPTVKIGKLGRKTYVELDFMVSTDEGWTVDDADRFRRRLMTALSEPGRLLWINAELHTDPAWDTADEPG
jgi:predicted Co/Zn/Cd cation transporter (cation efflux family)